MVKKQLQLSILGNNESHLFSIASSWEGSSDIQNHKVIDPYQEQIVVNKSLNIAGNQMDICLKGTPIEFGRSSNYVGRRQAIVGSKGYILAFEHEPPYKVEPPQILEHLNYYATMPSQMRKKKEEKHNFPFLIIGSLGASETEVVTSKEVDQWASKYFTRWEYIVIDMKKNESEKISEAIKRLVPLADALSDSEIEPEKEATVTPHQNKTKINKQSQKKKDTSFLQSFLNFFSFSNRGVATSA